MTTTPDLAADLLTTEQFADKIFAADIGGPQKISFEELARTVLARRGDDKTVVVDPQATYFGTPLARNSLVTAD
jgi:hypothetical protein